VVQFFARQPDVDAVLLTCSCARGKASRDSCLDLCVLLPSDLDQTRRRELEMAWEKYNAADAACQAVLQVGKYSQVDLEFSDGQFAPGYHGWTSGPDEFELAVGNLLAYSVPLWEQGEHLKQLKAQWLPYYADDLRRERLGMVRRYCLNNLDHIPLYVERGLYFQSFRRLYNALGEFLQALFIARRIYPIAYDKWVREQIVDILGLPDLYACLPRLFELDHFESREIADKARNLKELFDHYVLAQCG